MKIVQINSTCGIGSIGKICQSISQILTNRGVENYILYTQGKSDYLYSIKYSNCIYTKIQALISRILGNYGFNSYFITYKLIHQLRIIKPDIVHIHNIHSHNCNLKLLFSYLRKSRIKIFYTFHDCWAFTGYCMYFDMDNCTKWMTKCSNCPQKKTFSWFLDRSCSNYIRKKKIFEDLNMTIITPSIWLSNLVKKSFLKNNKIKVINNGIDFSIFKPTVSDFRVKYGILNKFILLGVAIGWSKRKGLEDIIELANRLDNNFQIVVIGTNLNDDKILPPNVISIHRTQNQKELAEIYTTADLLINPTKEENFPTVNIESLACGTPVLTYNTGGSPEIIDKTCGAVVEKGNIDQLEKEIIRIYSTKPFLSSNCIYRSKLYDMHERFKEYVTLYQIQN